MYIPSFCGTSKNRIIGLGFEFSGQVLLAFCHRIFHSFPLLVISDRGEVTLSLFRCIVFGNYLIFTQHLFLNFLHFLSLTLFLSFIALVIHQINVNFTNPFDYVNCTSTLYCVQAYCPLKLHSVTSNSFIFKPAHLL